MSIFEGNCTCRKRMLKRVCFDHDEVDWYRAEDARMMLEERIKTVMPVGKKFKLVKMLMETELKDRCLNIIDLGWKKYTYRGEFKMEWNFEFGTFGMSKLMPWGKTYKYLVIASFINQ